MKRQLLRIVLSFTLALGVFPLLPSQPASAAPNYFTLSYYMAAQTTSSATVHGCDLGNHVATTPGYQEVQTMLFFGGPRMSGSAARASNWSYADYSMADVQALAFAFAQGFFGCAASGGDTTSLLGVAVSTSNDGYMSSSLVGSHGDQWGNMALALHNQLRSQSWGSRAWGLAGTDVEPGFAWNPTNSRLWINRTRSKNYPRPFISNPTAFCSTSGTYSASTACGYGWTAEDVASVSFWVNEGARILPVPQIYSWHYAARFYRLSKYSASTIRGKFQFDGVMSQWRACQQNGCSTYCPTSAFDDLQSTINGDSATAWTIRDSMLDVRWATGSNSGATP